MMPSLRNKNGEVVRGKGAKLTELQKVFVERVANEGLENASKIAKDMGYTNYYRDRRKTGTAFYKEIMAIADSEGKTIEAAKGTNLNKLIWIRDTALANDDMKTAMEAIKIINSMQGYIAPTKVEQTKFDVKATIDLTAPKEEEDDFLDIDYSEE
jgi:hypothetical protein